MFSPVTRPICNWRFVNVIDQHCLWLYKIVMPALYQGGWDPTLPVYTFIHPFIYQPTTLLRHTNNKWMIVHLTGSTADSDKNGNLNVVFPLERVTKVFQEKLQSHDVSTAIAAIKTLLDLIREGKGSTVYE